jgi:hypothetical protein
MWWSTVRTPAVTSTSVPEIVTEVPLWKKALILVSRDEIVVSHISIANKARIITTNLLAEMIARATRRTRSGSKTLGLRWWSITSAGARLLAEGRTGASTKTWLDRP